MACPDQQHLADAAVCLAIACAALVAYFALPMWPTGSSVNKLDGLLLLLVVGALGFVRPARLNNPSIRTARRGRQPRALTAKSISTEDLPPEGTRSLFDHLIAQNDVLPYPLKTRRLIAKQSPDGQAPLAC